MSANPKCRIQLTHSVRPLKVLEVTWLRLSVEWFKMYEPHIIPIYEALKKDGRAQHTDASGTLFMVALDNIEASNGS